MSGLTKIVPAQTEFAERYDSLTAFEQLFARKNTGELADELIVTANQAAASGLPTFGADLTSRQQFDRYMPMAPASSANAHADTRQNARFLQSYMQETATQANAAAVQHSSAPGSRSSPRCSGDSGSDLAPPSSSHKRSRTTDTEEMQDLDVSDPEERKLEKRRAKNRRTARVSRERKQAELSNLKAELATRTAEVARLQQVIQMKDRQILKMAGMSSYNSGACLSGAQSQRWGALEPANERAHLSKDCARPICNDLYGVFN